MGNKKYTLRKYIFSTITVLAISNVSAVLGPITIYSKTDLTSGIIRGNDFEVAYPSEIYTADDIKYSNSANIYDFLTKNSSIAFTPAYGNIFSQQINARGFGLTNGHENIVITLDGRKLNNIDSGQQFLANINLNNIEKIEITKGSGSVIYGDGATSGAIHIFTKNDTGSTINVAYGNYDTKSIGVTTGFSYDKFSLSLIGDKTQLGGYSNKDKSGNRTNSSNDNKKAVVTLTPSNDTNILLAKTSSNVDTRYPNYLTLAQFNTNPSQYPVRFGYGSATINYTQQKYDIKNIDFNITHKIKKNFSVYFDYNKEDKSTNNISFNTLYDYKNYHKTLLFDYKKDRLNIIVGSNILKNNRKQTSNITSKDNKAYFIKSIYSTAKNNFSSGLRYEKISYEYRPSTGDSLSDFNKLKAYDIGINHIIDDNISIFTNYNNSYQAPSIDNFFTFNANYTAQIFNEFIKPSKVKTLNVGLNYITNYSKTKFTIYRINLKNEIYYYKITAFSGRNTNIDKSHKQGFELQHKQKLNNKLDFGVNYAYTIAKIDVENEASTTYNNKNMPGVSKHDIALIINYKISKNNTIIINNKYRSSAYSAEDFANNMTQKQKAFTSTDISYNYHYSDNLGLSVNLENAFKKSSGFWLRDDVIYPTNFTRNITARVFYKF